MANMSYCRFENTLKDLQDCYHNWEEPESDFETRARAKLHDLCKRIIKEKVV